MEKLQDTESKSVEKKSKKTAKEPAAFQTSDSGLENAELKYTVKIIFEGEAAQRILKCEGELKERLSKPDMGKIIGNEILTWTDKRWSELVEENTDIDYFFAQIRKCPDKSKSIKLLKALSEKLKNETPEGTNGLSPGLPIASATETESNVG